MSDMISRQAAIDAILAVTGNSSVRELYEHVQEHGLSEMWSGGVNAAIDTIIAVPSAQPEPSTEIQEILEYLDTTLHPIVSPDNWNVYSELHDMVSRLPSAQPEQRWIPVSERLPEDEYVLISKIPTKISGNKWSVAIAIRTADQRSRKIQWRDSGFGVIQDDKVLAWMPLPEPYREDNNG